MHLCTYSLTVYSVISHKLLWLFKYKRQDKPHVITFLAKDLQRKTPKMFKQRSFFPPRFISSALRKHSVSQSYFIVFVWRGNTLTCLSCHASSQLSESASAREVRPQHTILTHQRQAKMTPYTEPPWRGVRIFNTVSWPVLLNRSTVQTKWCSVTSLCWLVIQIAIKIC